MNGEQTFAHGLFAFFVPIAWAAIIYPICRKYKKNWIVLLVVSVVLSLLAMVVKEFFDDHISINDIVADILGIFFGSAVVALTFLYESQPLESEKDLCERPSVPQKKAKREETYVFSPNHYPLANRKVSLRILLSMGVKVELRGEAYYRRASRKVSNPEVKIIFAKLAAEQKEQARGIQNILEKWLPRPLDPNFANWFDLEIIRHDIFTTEPTEEVTEREALEYAIRSAMKIRGLYRIFMNCFPEEWKKLSLEELINEKDRHAEMLREELKVFIQGL